MKIIIFFLTLIFLFPHCQTNKKNHNIKALFKKYNVQGSFILYDLRKDQYFRYNPERCKKGFLPASTFKILNSLIALEEKVIEDENTIFKWDGKKREYSVWNRDHDLKTAYQNSVVWYYQELARKIGLNKMNNYLKQVDYGNLDTSAGIDQFWLKGNFKITQEEQIHFLKRLYLNTLPFSKQNMDTVKRIMTYEDNEEYSIKAKTGLIIKPDVIGWWVGWYKFKKTNAVYFFATNLSQKNYTSDFPSVRIKLTKDIFKELEIISKK